MTSLGHVLRLPFSLDPLIAEAKRRARRRRSLILILSALLVATGAAVAVFELRSPPPPVPISVSPPSTPPTLGVGWEAQLGMFPVVAYGVGSVWAASVATPQHAHGQLVRLDPQTGKQLGVLPVGWWPSQVAVGAGGVWVADTVGDGSRVKNHIAGLANAVTRIDPGTNRVVATIRFPLIQSVTVGGGSVWTTALSGHGETISRINPAGNQVTALRTLPGVNGPLIWGGGHLWALTWFANPSLHARVWEIAPQSGRVVASRVLQGIGPNATLAYRSGVLWVGGRVAGPGLARSLIFWIRTRHGLSLHRREGVAGASDLVATGGGLWATGSGSLLLFGAKSGALHARLTLHGWVSVTANVLAASGGRAWVITQTATPKNVISHIVSVQMQTASGR